MTEVVNALQATEQRISIRSEEVVEGALVAKHKENGQSRGSNKDESIQGKFSPCPNYKKTNHTTKYCWFRKNAQCKICKKFGHIDKVCKNKSQQKDVQQS